MALTNVSCDRAIRCSGLGVRLVGLVGDFLDTMILGCPRKLVNG